MNKDFTEIKCELTAVDLWDAMKFVRDVDVDEFTKVLPIVRQKQIEASILKNIPLGKMSIKLANDTFTKLGLKVQVIITKI